jgi:hypothetical protein
LQVWNDQGVLKTALQYYGFLKESSEGGKNYIKLGELGKET